MRLKTLLLLSYVNIPTLFWICLFNFLQDVVTCVLVVVIQFACIQISVNIRVVPMILYAYSSSLRLHLPHKVCVQTTVTYYNKYWLATKISSVQKLKVYWMWSKELHLLWLELWGALELLHFSSSRLHHRLPLKEYHQETLCRVHQVKISNR